MCHQRTTTKAKIETHHLGVRNSHFRSNSATPNLGVHQNFVAFTRNNQWQETKSHKILYLHEKNVVRKQCEDRKQRERKKRRFNGSLE